MEQYLSRKFIIVGDIDNYFYTLNKKMVKAHKNYDIYRLEKLFDKLKKLKLENEKEYDRVANKLKSFSEEFVIKNSWYVNCVLNLTEEQRKIILLNFNYIKYNDDLDVIDLIKLIIQDFEKMIFAYIDCILNSSDFSKEQMYNIALECLNRKDKKFIGDIMDSFMTKYPMVNCCSIFSELCLQLFTEIGSVAYTYIIKIIENKEKLKSEEIRKYVSEQIVVNVSEKIKKEQCGSVRKLM